MIKQILASFISISLLQSPVFSAEIFINWDTPIQEIVSQWNVSFAQVFKTDKNSGIEGIVSKGGLVWKFKAYYENSKLTWLTLKYYYDRDKDIESQTNLIIKFLSDEFGEGFTIEETQNQVTITWPIRYYGVAAVLRSQEASFTIFIIKPPSF